MSESLMYCFNLAHKMYIFALQSPNLYQSEIFVRRVGSLFSQPLTRCLLHNADVAKTLEISRTRVASVRHTPYRDIRRHCERFLNEADDETMLLSETISS